MNTDRIIQEIFHETNRQRDAFRLSVLRYSKKLEQAATLHSGNMVKHNFFSHENTHNPEFANVMDRVLYCKGDFTMVAENLAYYPFKKNGMVVLPVFRVAAQLIKHPQQNLCATTEYAKAVVAGWMNSPGHRANIFNAELTHIGIGIVMTGENQHGVKIPYGMVTQNFGGYHATCNLLRKNITGRENHNRPYTIKPIGSSGKKQDADVKQNRSIIMNTEIVKFGTNVDVPANFDQKCLVVIVADTSYSMDGSPIEKLNTGLQDFHRDIRNDHQLNGQLELGIVKFDSTVKVLQQPALPDDFQMPTLTVGGSTRLCDGVREGFRLIDDRKKWYKSTGQKYYRPWLILITDGAPDPGQDVNGLSSAMQTAHQSKAFNFIPIGVESADFNLLKKIAQPGVAPLKLSGLKFTEFFQFLSASIGKVVNSSDGDTIDLGFAQVAS